MSENSDKVKGPATYFPGILTKHGRSIAEWQQVLRSAPGYGTDAKHLQLVTWLKTEHGFGHGHANALVAHTRAEDGL